MINVVISGINFTSGGPLSVMRDFLIEINHKQGVNVVALVNSVNLYPVNQLGNISFIEFPKSKSSWLFRLWYEYFYFRRLSESLGCDIWISMHDITPVVHAKYLVTYCHNASPFCDFDYKYFRFDKKFAAFNLFYRYLYRINVKSNDFVVVQQHWMKAAFEKLLPVREVVVARPNISEIIVNASDDKIDRIPTFVFPAFPRVFKNFEVICKAADLVSQNFPNVDFNVLITIDGSENDYSRWIVDEYSRLRCLKFIGLRSRDEVYEIYRNSDALIFPSKLETWGLPITEYRQFDKPIFCSDLPYARETSAGYNKVKYFNPDDYRGLAKLMLSLIRGERLDFDIADSACDGISGWAEFFEYVLMRFKTR